MKLPVPAGCQLPTGCQCCRGAVALLITERKKRGLRQQELANRLQRPQSWVSRLEGGTRHVKLIEFFELADAIGFDPWRALRKITKKSCLD